jgi:hypothetical protein
MTTRNSVAQLYTPIYDEFMLAEFKEESQVHGQVYETIEDKTKEYKVDDLSTLGIWESANEGAGGGYEDPVLGYPKTYTQAKYWKKFQVSFEAVDQDEYALLKKENEARSMGRGSRAKVESDTANYLYDGFATAAADGQYLWDSDHPKNSDETAITYSNLLSGAFSHDNLEAAETQITNNFIGPDGIPIMPTEDPVLLYPPALRGAVKRVLSERATEQPDTTMRNINRFAGRYKAIEWRWLAAAFGGSDTAWYIIYPELGFLKIVWSAKPHFTSWVDEDNEFYKFKGRMLYAFGASNWRCGFASTGV